MKHDVPGPTGRVIMVIFRGGVSYPEAYSICCDYGSLHQLNQRERSFLLYLKGGIGIDKVDKMISKLRKNRKVRDAVLMSP